VRNRHPLRPLRLLLPRRFLLGVRSSGHEPSAGTTPRTRVAVGSGMPGWLARPTALPLALKRFLAAQMGNAREPKRSPTRKTRTLGPGFPRSGDAAFLGRGRWLDSHPWRAANSQFPGFSAVAAGHTFDAEGEVPPCRP
jgi:hypothetical protein